MNLAGRLVLDTSAYSHLRAGHDEVLDRVASAAVVIVPVIVIGELQAAFEMGSRTLENQQTLAEFLDEPFVRAWSVTTATTAHYARIFTRLRDAGTPIPINDVWIAATTKECNGYLLTFDRDFSRVEGLDHSTLETA